ncbi:MAG TPA: RNA-binding protein [Kiritimatiellia bacterium]|nr:RNA-binding protein [Kiritimatiellia bacterium]HMO98107.1 RNA-binding protein [Kiritimatiellia bacterium]HMP96313.1 RNA-binding protein [Kiritimatiellia bacterium]
MATKLYVGNLSFGTTEGDLQNLFASCGQVTSCSMIIDKFTGKSRGFAFVEMASPAEAQKAIDELHGKDFDGRALTVNEARPREERPRGGGGGGYGGGGGGGYGGGRGGGGGGGGYGGGKPRRDRY